MKSVLVTRENGQTQVYSTIGRPANAGGGIRATNRHEVPYIVFGIVDGADRERFIAWATELATS